MNISLTDEMKDFVEKKVASGAFPSEEALLDGKQPSGWLRRQAISMPSSGDRGGCRRWESGGGKSAGRRRAEWRLGTPAQVGD